ncbi:MAG: DNA mismatch repair endonuclease MutL [Bacillota bacterium]
MSEIIKLDKSISDKIAAGEVIENPAAVIKELIENSIDANAKKIVVEIKDAGKSYIRVTDDGEGIQPTDVLLAFDRHATSKIKSIEDIYSINTLGFRGEALPSIASVSRLELVTKTKNNDSGIKVTINGSDIVDKEMVGTKEGTTIIVKDLFYNTPARIKFLNKNSIEKRRINKLMNKLSLSNPNISFKYIVDNKVKFVTPGKGNLKNVVLSIYGKNIARNMMEVNNKLKGVKLSGLISNLSLTRGNSTLQVFFVNNRYIESDLIKEAIKTAYKTMIPIHKYPIVFLNFKIDPKKIDVNIHPSKTRIKFTQKGVIKQLIYTTIKSNLMKYDQTPSVNLNVNKETIKENNDNLESTKNSYSQKLKNIKKTNDNPKEKDNKSCKSNKINKKPFGEKSNKTNKGSEIDLNIFDVDFEELSKKENKNIRNKKLEKTETIYDNLEIIGQIFETYIICQKDELMYLIDQHAAHEKVMYEKLIKEFRNKNVDSQVLIAPETIDVGYNSLEVIMKNKKKFNNLGIRVDEFGKNSIVIREVPILFGSPLKIEVVKNILLDFNKDYKNAYDSEVDKIIQKSCKSAIKASDKLDFLEIKELINLLKKLNDPYTCPHGRPIIISITKDELEKKFKRK